MKTSIDIPDPLFRKGKSKAAEQGQSWRDFVTEALQEKLSRPGHDAHEQIPPWMAGFGKLSRLRSETARIQARIDEEFEVIEPEDRA